MYDTEETYMLFTKLRVITSKIKIDWSVSNLMVFSTFFLEILNSSENQVRCKSCIEEGVDNEDYSIIKEDQV